MDSVRPNFLIIGSAKCGTTALSKILDLHPNCSMSRPKEPEFFNSDENYEKGMAWYSRCWSHRNDEQIIGEATPRYTRRDLYPLTLQRIEEFDPNLKFVHIARDPYEKFVSFWRMWARGKLLNGGQYLGIGDFFRSYENISEIVRSCMYEYQLEPYLERFGDDQFHFMLSEDLRKNERVTIERLFKFLDLESDRIESFLGISANSAEPIKGSMAKRLKNFLRRLRGGVESKSVYVQREDLSPDLLAEFRARVYDDACAHLKRLGKSTSIWNLES